MVIETVHLKERPSSVGSDLDPARMRWVVGNTPALVPPRWGLRYSAASLATNRSRRRRWESPPALRHTPSTLGKLIDLAPAWGVTFPHEHWACLRSFFEKNQY